MSEVAVKEQLTLRSAETECPMTVKQAAKFLGVSPQTVYLRVERKQIPHLRVMGRNIRFLKRDLESFRVSFKHEMENAWKTKSRWLRISQKGDKSLVVHYRDRNGICRSESTGT